MDLLPAHEIAMAEFNRAVAAIGDDQWAAATPCSDWTVHDLLNHLVSEQLWVPALLGGATIAEVGDRFDGDQLGVDPRRAWAESAVAARVAWVQPGAIERTVHLSFGDTTAAEYGWQMTLDLAVHGWDLSTAVNSRDHRGDPGVVIDPDLAETLLERFEDQVEQWRGSGIFGPPVPVPDHSDAPTRLLALLGRNPR